MQKNQTFSCLFRHYAKHNGLRKEDLAFYFVDELLPDQMPETVHLMPQDEIWVELRKPPEVQKEQELDAEKFPEQFRSLLESGDHSDVTFIVGDLREEVCAHKAILSARSEYFKAMFRKGGMAESTQSIVEIGGHDKQTFSKMLEHIYTDTVANLESCSPNDVMTLLQMANEFCLDELQRLCEHAASKVLSFDNIGRFMLMSSKFGASELRDACKKYVREHGTTLRSDDKFRLEIEEFPQLGLLLFDAWQDEHEGVGVSSSMPSKRRRLAEPTESTGPEFVPAQPNEANTIAPNPTGNRPQTPPDNGIETNSPNNQYDMW
jgi:hypothetical protein